MKPGLSRPGMLGTDMARVRKQRDAKPQKNQNAQKKNGRARRLGHAERKRDENVNARFALSNVQGNSGATVDNVSRQRSCGALFGNEFQIKAARGSVTA